MGQTLVAVTRHPLRALALRLHADRCAALVAVFGRALGPSGSGDRPSATPESSGLFGRRKSVKMRTELAAVLPTVAALRLVGDSSPRPAAPVLNPPAAICQPPPSLVSNVPVAAYHPAALAGVREPPELAHVNRLVRRVLQTLRLFARHEVPPVFSHVGVIPLHAAVVAGPFTDQ